MALYVVATPIGNLDDLSARAVAVLGAVRCIAAEDTRHSRRLLEHYGIRTPLRALHDHSTERQMDALLELLRAGEDIALISDAGTPLLNDPGFPLVRACRQEGLTVLPVPGANSAIAALSVLGLPVDRFYYEGFLPSGTGRDETLKLVAELDCSVILLEAPQRVLRTVEDLCVHCGDTRLLGIAREMTKRHEQYEVRPLSECAQALRDGMIPQRGEFVLVLEGRPDSAPVAQELKRTMRVLLDELPASAAARVAARLTGARRRDAFALAQSLKSDGSDDTDS